MFFSTEKTRQDSSILFISARAAELLPGVVVSSQIAAHMPQNHA